MTMKANARIKRVLWGCAILCAVFPLFRYELSRARDAETPGVFAASDTEVDLQTPRVEGDTISLPSRSPQLDAILIEPAEAVPPPVEHLNGRAVWNDNVTVRIFSPVAGRVAETGVDLGQIVARGDPLAL